MKKSVVISANTVTLSAFARAAKVPISTASGWRRHPLWQWPRKGKISLSIVPDVLRWAAENLERGRPSTESLDPATAQTIRGLREQKLREEIRKLRAQADVAESELKERAGKLMPIEEVQRAGVGIITSAKNTLLGLPSRVSPRLANCDGATVQDELTREVHETLNELARGFRELGKQETTQPA